MKANVGMTYAVASPVATYTPYSGITYGSGYKVAESRGANVTLETQDGEFYGDDVILDNLVGVIGYNIEFGGSTPRRTTAGRGIYLDRSVLIGILSRLAQIHRRAIRTEAHHTLIGLGIQVSFYKFGLLPHTIFIFLCQENVVAFYTGYRALLVAGSLVARTRNVQLIILFTLQHRRTIAATRIEESHLLDTISSGIFFPIYKVLDVMPRYPIFA